MRRYAIGLVQLLLVSGSATSAMADSAQVLNQQCAACHALTKPTDTSLDRLWARKGPDLYYAGVKFKRDWLVAWLQNPTALRPAGYPYFKDVVSGKEHDEVDQSKLSPHPKVAKADVEAVADALMALKGPPGLVDPSLYKDGEPTNARMAELAFTKLRGCAACHEGAKGEGGASGPELTDAGKRLQPAFIANYISDPQKFDPHVWMPTPKLNPPEVQRLTSYIASMGTEEQK